ncbi:MAG: hypothetical protein ND807_08070, partial [Vicinamibacterales bacterium]|nr:hypothetical protein [Vicinamibacterales bacterium]
LYARASIDGTSPLANAAQALLQSLQASLSAEEFQRCVMLSSIGLGHQFQPVTFTLETGHWISLDLEGATIVYQGKETRTELGFATSGIVFLPVKYTELTSYSTPRERRHFIEFFSWSPAQQPRTWTLLWRVFEVVREQLVDVTNADLGTISVEQPPAGNGVDTRTMAGLRVNDDGLLMWEVLQGPDRGSELIETEAEREEVREEARVQKAANDRVNWDLVRDVRRRPALAYSGAGGCGNTFVHGWSDDRTEAISVRADRDALGLSTTPKTFDLSSTRDGLELLVHVYDRAMRRWPFCTDSFALPAAPTETWRVVGGTLTITLSPPGIRARAPYLYRATIRIVGAELISAAGARVKLTQPISLTAVVGWFTG